LSSQTTVSPVDVRFTDALRARDWPTVAGYGLFVAVLAAGYYYNLTFVQLGLVDLGTRVLALSRTRVSAAMAVLAVSAFLAAVAVGTAMDRRGWSRDLDAKLRLLWLVVLVQAVLTPLAPRVEGWAGLLAWVLACGVSLGAGMPATFALAVDLVPVEDRGAVAAAATAGAYFLANVYPLEWRVESFALAMTAAMVPAVVLLGALASGRPDLVEAWRGRHRDPAVGVGRFCRPRAVDTWSFRLWWVAALMFGVYFVDSLGFLRIVETPALVGAAWQSPDLGVHLLVGGVHVLAAAMAGVLYASVGRRLLFLLVFGLFGFTHLMYVVDLRGGAADTVLAMPLLYAGAVSVYTVLNFALWPDLSTPATVGRHAAVGVGFAGFLATFASTAVALYFDGATVALVDYLTLVDALALLLFLGLAVATYLHRVVELARERGVES
jgi:MFS family permease